MGNKLLTVPDILEEVESYFPVGNEWVSLPDIDDNGAIRSFNLLSRAHKGMIEFSGGASPLLVPIIEIDGRPFDATIQWERIADWVPQLEGRLNNIAIQGTIFAPNGYKGFVYVLRLHNESDRQSRCKLGWSGNWENTDFTIYRSRPSGGKNVAWYNPWTRTLTFEHRTGLPVAAWSVGLSSPLSELAWQLSSDPEDEGTSDRVEGSVHFRVEKEILLEAGSTAELALFVGVNSEADGASTCTVDLQRHGWEELLNTHLSWVRGHLLVPEKASRAAQLCNLNAFYNYFFARGRCIDSEDWVLMTSRSPRYYVSAAFWARDAFLWSLPGILAMDVDAARDTLLLGHRLYFRNASIHSLYIDGTELYPGFELDELCAYFIALEQYIDKTGDWQIVNELGSRICEDFRSKLSQWRGENGLYATFLSPTDDPVEFAYLTYDNALVWRVLKFIARIYEEMGQKHQYEETLKQADTVYQAIREHCIVPGPSGPMYAWAINEKGGFQLLDQPPGSLQLLEYYGFCALDEAAYQNTVAWIHSEQNPDYSAKGVFIAPACEHAPYPWVLSLCYDLLNGNRAKALELLSRAQLDTGIACETIDEETGSVKTGAAFATCAGFLAYSLSIALR